MNTSQSHWTECRRLAEDYPPAHSIVYAKDHLEALEMQRIGLRPQEFTPDEWVSYKDTTASIQGLLQQLRTLLDTIHTEQSQHNVQATCESQEEGMCPHCRKRPATDRYGDPICETCFADIPS